MVAKILQESNLNGIGIFMSVITLNKFGKRVRGCCVHVFLVKGLLYRIFVQHANSVTKGDVIRF